MILGKTNLSEWANFRSTHSSSGWSGRGGQTHNPYALDRNPCGSSSGSGAAVAANLCAVAVGTETDGSIVCPVVGQRRRGHQADGGPGQPRGNHSHLAQPGHRGPMAARLPTRRRCSARWRASIRTIRRPRCHAGKRQPDYTKFLDRGGLRGARIGVVRKFFDFSDGFGPRDRSARSKR